MEVIMGAGHPFYDADGQLRADVSFKFMGENALWTELNAGTAGNNADGDSIIDYWILIDQRTDFQRLMHGPAPKRVFGIARIAETLQQKRSGDKNALPFTVPLIATVPTLAEMTLAAFNVLDADPDGFCIMIEGGAVDWASHENQSGRMIEEEIDF
jgi:alkaline phosphatase